MSRHGMALHRYAKLLRGIATLDVRLTVIFSKSQKTLLLVLK